MMTKQKDSAEKAIRDIRRVTRRQYSAEEKICIVLEGLRGESSIAELCRLVLSHMARWFQLDKNKCVENSIVIP
jgi:transposase-like protein